MRLTTTADQSWTTAVGYCLDVERFASSTGEGQGDLGGLGAHLDHLTRLGVGFVWLRPIYPSPEGDDGDDISDYYGVDPEIGTLGDVVEVVRACRERGMRVLVDLVVDHTSSEHPWFRQARASKSSRYRDWYVWRDEQDPADADAADVFPDAEDSIWSYDDVAGQRHRHRFYKTQPDLNTSDLDVRDEILRIMGFWLQLGFAGFRVDAVPFFVETAARTGDADDAGGSGDGRGDGEGSADAGQGGEAGDRLEQSMQVLDVMRAFLSRRSSEALMLGEVNLPHAQQVPFFGGTGDRMTIHFDFTLNQAMYLGLTRGTSVPLREALASRPELPDGKSFGVFARNHDELTLDQLAEDERAEVLAASGPREDQQLFGRGLRLRLPTILSGDQPRMEMVHALVFSVPGVPVLCCGEEVGQREDLSVPGRVAVRTPLDWGRDVPTGVAAQEADPGSMLHAMRRLVARYRDRPELGRGVLRLLDVGDERVLAHARTWEGRTTLALADVSTDVVEVRLPGGVLGGDVVELFSGEPVDVPADGLAVTLPASTYRWYGDAG